MIAILCLSAITAGFLTFWYLRRTELAKFHTVFKDDASKVGQALHKNIINVLG
jgi:hypothetical protein